MIRDIYKVVVVLGVAVSGMFFACKGEGPQRQREEIQFDVSIKGVAEIKTKATIAGNAFSVNDQFRMFFNMNKPDTPAAPSNHDTDPVVRDFKYVSAAVKWQPVSTPLYWDDYTISTRDFCAYSTYDASMFDATYDKFTVKEDQITLAKYLDNDLLMARARTSKRLVPVPFYHIMSRINVVITASTEVNDPRGWFTEAEIDAMTVSLKDMYVEGNLTYGALVTDQTPTATVPNHAITATANLTGVKKDIAMYNYSTNKTNKDKYILKYYAVVIPPRGAVANGTDLISAKIGGNEYLFTTSSTVPVATLAQQGKQTTFNITLYKKNIIPIDISSSISIEPWGTKEYSGPDPIVVD